MGRVLKIAMLPFALFGLAEMSLRVGLWLGDQMVMP